MAALMNSGKLTSHIAQIGKRVAVTRDVIHMLAVQCIGYAVVHGDIMHGVRLLEAVGKHDKRAMVAFFEREGNFAYDTKAKKMVFKRNYEADSWDDARVDCLTKGKKWDDYAKSPEISSIWDVEEQLSKLIKSYEHAVKSGKEIMHRALFEAVLEAKAAYSGALADEQLRSESEES